MVLKLDLFKEYDHLDWGFLGLNITTYWIGRGIYKLDHGMCVHSIRFVILINGSPTSFFRGTRDLRQGCPLSPLLFFLINEGPRKIIESDREKWIIEGINISKIIRITHLLFVDDVMIFEKGSLGEWGRLKYILDKFSRSSGMLISDKKYIILHHGIEYNTLDSFRNLFRPYCFKPIDEGIKTSIG